MKYKATINIDRELWDDFKAKCQDNQTTASEEVRKFISSFCLEQGTSKIQINNHEKSLVLVKQLYDDIECHVTKIAEKKQENFERKIEKKLEAIGKLLNFQ